MALEYFPWYNSYFKKCEKLTDQELGRLVRALSMYSVTGERQELAGRESIAFDFIADDIDRAKEAYDEKCAKNKKNIESRYERIQSNTTVYEGYQTKTKTKDKSKTKDKDNISPPNGGRDTRAKRFIPPSVDEVKAYCTEMSYGVDAEAFVDFYAARGWSYGTGKPMKDWKAAVRTWVKRDKERVEPGKKRGKEQPDYQPSAERIKATGDWLDRFLDEQGGTG